MKHPLLASKLLEDPRIAQARKLILESIEDHKIQITSIKPPSEDQTQYQALVDILGSIRGMPLYYPYIGSGFGSGPYVELADGSIKLDMISGIGPNLLGHSHLGIAEALIDSALTDTVLQGNLMHNMDALHLAQKLTEISGLDHCFLSSSGAMACENALKVLFQHHYPANRVLAFEHCFIGRSIALSQITDKPTYRQGLPQLLHVDYIPFYNHLDPLSTQKTLEMIEMYIARYPGQHACICLELIQGEGGIIEGTASFFEAIIDLCRSKRIGIYVDEVQTYGRTETLFAHHLYGLKDKVDVVSIGKVSLVCATLYNRRLAPKPGLLSQTFTASTASIKASLWFLENLDRLNLYGPEGKINLLAHEFHAALSALNKRIPNSAQGPYGRGALIAFSPFNWDLSRVNSFLKRLYINGVIAFSAGSHPARVRMLPPIAVMEKEHIETVISIIEKSIREEIGQL